MSKITKHIESYYPNGKPQSATITIDKSYYIEVYDVYGNTICKDKDDKKYKELLWDFNHNDWLRIKELEEVLEILKDEVISVKVKSKVSKKLAQMTDLKEGDEINEYEDRKLNHSDRLELHLQIVDDMILNNIDLHYSNYTNKYLKSKPIQDDKLERIFDINIQYAKDRLKEFNSDEPKRIRVKDDVFRWEEITKAKQVIDKHKYHLEIQDFHFKWEVMYDIRVKLIESIIIIPKYEYKFWLAVKIAFENYAHMYSVNGSKVNVDEYDIYAKAWENQVRLLSNKEVVDLVDEWKEAKAKAKYNHL